MRRAFFIVYDYPPCNAAGAAVRSAKFVKYLGDFGWKATVLCLDEGGRSADHEQPDVIRVPPLTPARASYRLTVYGWVANLARACTRAFEERPYDLIYASCPPFLHPFVALRLKRRFGTPVVVDFRDAWSLEPFVGGGRITRAVRARLRDHVFPHAERMILRGADLFIANTPSMKREYERRYPFLEGKCELLTNGFDDADFNVPSKERGAAPFTMLYCGRFYDVLGRSPDLVLRALRILRDEGADARLRIVGDDSSRVRARIAKYSLESAVSVTGQVPHDRAIRVLQECDVLLLYQPHSETSVTPVAGKTFEYVRSAKPILGIVPPGDNLDLVRDNAGRHVLVATNDVDDVVTAMRTYYDEWKSGSLPRHAAPNRFFVRKYDRRNLTRRLAALFDRVADDQEHRTERGRAADRASA